jgi:hypothetical protein
MVQERESEMRALPPTATDLKEALGGAGFPGDLRVSGVTVVSDRNTILSRIMRLGLTYDGQSVGAPASVILKTGLPERLDPAWNGGPQEVEFYTRIAPDLPSGIVPRCFDAQSDPESHAWHLLLEDLTDTHSLATRWPLPPTQKQCETILAASARFHATWWDDPRLGVSVGRWPDSGHVARLLRDMEAKYAQFANRLADNLPPERRALFQRFFEAVPRLAERVGSRRNVTIVHGDLHVWNLFLPRDGSGDVRLFDWDSWRLNISTSDLAYMMAMHWYPDRRAHMEQPLLDHYHSTLLEHGVSGYDRRALDDDYRLSVLLLIMRPVWQMVSDIPPLIWWNNLERILLAVDDLGCRELLG